jgi:hypothetical protein
VNVRIPIAENESTGRTTQTSLEVLFTIRELGSARTTDTDYGLAADIATGSTDLAHGAAAHLKAGIAYVNAYGPNCVESARL